MIYSDLEQALINKVKPLIPNGVAVSWPNAELSGSKGDNWWDIDDLVADDRAITVGDHGENEVRGVLQILIKVKPNIGTKLAKDQQTALAKGFKAGSSFTHGQAHVIFIGARPGPAFTSGEYYTVPLSINYYARYSRTLGD